MECKIMNEHKMNITLDRDFIENAIREKILSDNKIEVDIKFPIKFLVDTKENARLRGATIEFYETDDDNNIS